MGFFYQQEEEDRGALAAPWFFALSSRFPHADLDALFDGYLFRSSSLVSSRKGRLVLELRRASRTAGLRLAVCNPMTGDVSVLPVLSGKERPRCYYACALLAAADLPTEPLRSSESVFRLILVYNRRNFTLCRSYSSDAGSWAPERTTTGATLGSTHLGQMHDAVAVRGSVFWQAKCDVVGLRIDTLEVTVERHPRPFRTRRRSGDVRPEEKRVLTVSPDGRLCVVEFDGFYSSKRRSKSQRFLFLDKVLVQIHFRDDGDSSCRMFQWNMMHGTSVRLESPVPDRGDGEGRAGDHSGVIFFSANHPGHPSVVYAVDIERKVARVIKDTPDVSWCHPESCRGFHGYEMDRVAYLTSLGEGDGNGTVGKDQ